MIAPTLNYIESDFADPFETFREYRVRAVEPPQSSRMRRAYRRLLRLA